MKQIKKRSIVSASLLAFCLAVAGVTVVSQRPAVAACAVPATNYGSATMQLQVATAGNYRIWTHMLAPDTTNNSLLLEIDGSSCYVVGDTAIPAQAWTWVNHQNGSTASTITATLSAGSHTIKVIGREPSVKVDRILAVSDQNCTPANLGENCMVNTDTTKPSVTITSPAENTTVSGSVKVTATATDNTGVSKVEFYVQDQLASTDTSTPYEYTWETANLPNATFTLTAKAYDAAGNSNTDIQAVIVKNGTVQAPSAPTNLVTTTIATNKVDLSWKASTGTVTGYRVVRNNVVIATVSGTTYSDTSVVAGTGYSYYVIAVGANNTASTASNIVNVTTPQPSTTDTQAPSKPSDLSATAVSSSQINIAWKASTDNTGVKEYDIYRNSDEDKNFTKIATTTATSYGDGRVYDNTTWGYYVIARDAAGNQSAKSDAASAYTPPLSQNGTSTLRGTVQGQNGRPIAGAKVTIWVNDKRYQTTTNYRGRYIITNIPAGTYEVVFRADGYRRSSETVRLTAGNTKWQDASLRR
jgi:hypothetical protein